MKLVYTFIFCAISQFIASQYFPPNNNTTWDTIPKNQLNWCKDSITSLVTFLDNKNSKSFIILKDGKIALEKYFDSYTKDSLWYYASAG